MFLTPARAAAAEPHFLVIGSELYLFSADERSAKEHCVSLQEYARYYLARNGREDSTKPGDCEKVTAFSLRGREREVVFPTQTDPEKVAARVGRAPGFVVAVGRWFPAEIWSRYQNRPQDGVCYNTALVESGVLPERARSSFVDSAGYFLGMNGVRDVSVGKSKVRVSYGPLSDSAVVKRRRSFEVGQKSKEELKREMDDFIRKNFSPGSVLCVSADDRETKQDLLRAMRGQAGDGGLAVDSNVAGLPEDYISESKGGHCLVFLTPGLISETNLRMPKNLVAWDHAFDFNHDLLARMDGKGRFHYMQIDSAAAVGGAWLRKQAAASPRLSALFELAERHRAFYESLAWKPCPHASQVNLYDPSCAATNADAVVQLRTFWQTEGDAVLEAPLFAEFREKISRGDSQSEGYRWNADYAAFEIFQQMWDTRKSVRR